MVEIDGPANGPWTIKGVPMAVRKRAVAAAYRRTGAWLTAAIEAYLASSQQPRHDEHNRAGPAKPWTVKGVSPASRDALTAAAKRSRMTVAEWLEAAVTYQSDCGQAPVIQAKTHEMKNIHDFRKILEMCDELLRLASDIRSECESNVSAYLNRS